MVKVDGLGDRSALLIRLAKELSGAYLKERIEGKCAVRSADDVVDYLTHELSGARNEKFLALYLNSKNEIIAVETLQEGTLNQTAVYPRKAIECALAYNARSIIFVHNHPSGDPTPSRADIKLTKELEKAARTVDIVVHDHIVIGKNSHSSIREHGWPGA